MLQAVNVADWFVAAANAEPLFIVNPKFFNKEQCEYQEGISHIKLQKMLYFAQAAHLSLYEKTLFEDDIEAWLYGPVVPTVFHVFKHHKNQFLEKPHRLKYKTVINQSKADFLKQIWESFGELSGSRLVAITHEHTPWQAARKKKNKKITPVAMKRYYKNIFWFV